MPHIWLPDLFLFPSQWFCGLVSSDHTCWSWMFQEVKQHVVPPDGSILLYRVSDVLVTSASWCICWWVLCLCVWSLKGRAWRGFTLLCSNTVVNCKVWLQLLLSLFFKMEMGSPKMLPTLHWRSQPGVKVQGNTALAPLLKVDGSSPSFSWLGRPLFQL